MAIFDYLSLLDTYGMNFNMPIKSKKTFNTYLTFTLSLITYALFITILYFQQEDFLYGINPNISYIKQSDLTSDDFKWTEKYFLPINIHVSSKRFKGDIINHLKKKLILKLRTIINGYINHDITTELYLDDCMNVLYEDDEEVKNDSRHDIHISNPEKTTYCINGFNFNKLKTYRFDRIDFEFTAEFDKCEIGDSSCQYDTEINKAFDNEDINITMSIYSARHNLIDSHWFFIAILFKYNPTLVK
jgi:hypothetical protein